MNSIPTVQVVQEAVNDSLRGIFTEKKKQAQVLHSAYNDFWSRIEEVVMSGGKRMRPYLTIVGYGALDEQILRIAVAQELVHCAILMHDDVIDQDFVRHGAQNISGLYRTRYSSFLDAPRATHYAHGAAIMAGDALLSEAYRQISLSHLPDTIKQHVSEQLSSAIFEVIGGELIDVEAAFVTDKSYDPLDVYRYKTAGYSIVRPLLAGALCSGVSGAMCRSLEQFGIEAGIAFQIKDDTLGTYGDEKVTGKPLLTDLREGKMTLLVSYHKQLMDEQARENFAHFGDVNASDEQLIVIRNDMTQSGAHARAEQDEQLYLERAARILETLGDDVRRAVLTEFLEHLSRRNA
ncbi:hypothetical protein B7Z28_01265 [Candidatus Saccharibacteria bacterium 32-45-3]|nr:MAG: hypothetical protein B7Z28_01265 [Candidatus Saccharibacteria bacterium 32-45-3]